MTAAHSIPCQTSPQDLLWTPPVLVVFNVSKETAGGHYQGPESNNGHLLLGS